MERARAQSGAAAGGRAVSEAEPALPPMPAAPSRKGPIGAVAYLVPVARAWWARRRALARQRAKLPSEVAALDAALGALGEAAYAERIYFPKLTVEMDAVAADEAHLARVVDDNRATATSAGRELNDLRDGEKRAAGELHEQSAEVARLEQLRAARADEERARAEEHAALARAIAALERRQQGLEASGAGADRRTVEDRRLAIGVERDQLAGRRDAAAEELAALRDALADIDGKLGEARPERERRARALDDLRARRRRAEQAAAATADLLGRARREAEIALRNARRRLGAVVYEQRPKHAAFEEAYRRIDGRREAVDSREAVIAALTVEAESFDRGALRLGLYSAGAALALLVIAIVIVAIAV